MPTRCRLIKVAIPLVHVSSSAAAEEFYCGAGWGFRREFAHRVDDAKPDPGYMGMTARWCVAARVVVFPGMGFLGGVVNLIVEDVDALHAETCQEGCAD